MKTTPAAVLYFISESIARLGYAPTFAEIADKFGLKSKAAVDYRLRQLERSGQIERVAYEPRGIKVVA